MERTNSGLAAARARGRNGGRKKRIQSRSRQEGSGKVRQGRYERCRDARLAGVSRQTLYRYLTIEKAAK